MLQETQTEKNSSRQAAVSAEEGGRITVIGGDALFRHGLEEMLTGYGFNTLGEDDLDIDLAIVIADGLTPNALMRVVDEMRHAGASYVAGLLTEPSAGDLSAALRAGLDGLLSRNMSEKALCRSVELVLLGENVFPTRVPDYQPNPHDEDEMADALGVSVRDLSMLRLLARGLSNRSISEQTDLPESTVKSQVRQALARIGAVNRTQAALWAIERGLDRDEQQAAQG